MVAAVDLDAVDGLRVPDEVFIRLVDHNDHIVGNCGQETLDLIPGEGRTRGVVRRAQQHHLGAVGDGSSHCFEVMAPVGAQRHLDIPGTGQADGDGVGLEGAPRVHHFIGDAILVLPGKGGQQLVEGAQAAAPGDNILGGDVEEGGEFHAQRRCYGIRVAVHVRMGTDGLKHGRQRREGVLVGRELVALESLDRYGRFPGGVTRQPVNDRARMDSWCRNSSSIDVILGSGHALRLILI